MTTPLSFPSDAVHLPAAQHVLPIRGFNQNYDAFLATYCVPNDAGRLVSVAETREAWNVWEVHPAGDELVVALSGRAVFIQDVNGTHTRVEVGPNQAIINPAGVPHTADVLEPFTTLYITPCPGTHHLPRK